MFCCAEPDWYGAADNGEHQFSITQSVDATEFNLVKASKAAVKVVDFSTWGIAWSSFATVLAERRLELASDLLFYQKTIAVAACQDKIVAWLAYDRSFRKLMASGIHLSCAHINPDLWLTRMVSRDLNAFCLNCKL